MTATLSAGSPPATPPALLNTDQVAELCGCSPRHIRRMADAGRMPKPIKLGNLLRFQRAAVEEWISVGCPNCRIAGKGAGQ